jgi:hypothetical protein
MTEPQEETSQQSTGPDLKEAAARLDSLQQHNQAELGSIGQLGIQIDPASLMAIRLNAFINFVFQRIGTPSPEIRQMLTTLFEVEYQEQVSAALTNVKAEARKATLAAGGQSLSKDDLKRMWQAQQNGHGPESPPGFLRS